MSSSNPPSFRPQFAFFLLLTPLMTILPQSNGCDLFQGDWVVDESYPLYNGPDCLFVTPPWNCQNNGRLDKMYLKYKWQPSNCSLVRFDGMELLKRLQGKKIMFIGDSLSWNMWQSLLCLVHNGVSKARYTTNQTELVTTISFTEFGASIMYMQTGFLVDLVNETMGRVLKLDSLSLSREWNEIDVLVFNSYHWWQHTGDLRKWDYIQIGEKTYKDMDPMVAYNIALTTWAKWVDSTIDPNQTKVFFQGISAMHDSGWSWGNPSVVDCDGQTEPVLGPNFRGRRYPGEGVIKDVLKKMKIHVCLLDITLLTGLRKDGHLSHWGNSAVDCSHWCLAGVPDTWNQILYMILRDMS